MSAPTGGGSSLAAASWRAIRRRRGQIIGALIVFAILSAVAATPGTIAMLRARDAAEAAATEAVAALGSSSQLAALQHFARARALFRQAQQRLDAPLASLGLAVPVLAVNLNAARTLAGEGVRLSDLGERIAQQVSNADLGVRSGRAPIEQLRRIAPLLAQADAVVLTSIDRLGRVHTTGLIGSLRQSIQQLAGRLNRDWPAIDDAAAAARLLPAMLGAASPRHYFLAFQNPAELRGTGGLIGNWGELLAQSGRLRLVRFGQLETLNGGGRRPRVLHMPADYVRRWRRFDVVDSWQQINVSPDFPTTARVIEDLYPQSGGHRIDGVIALDPAGLASLLTLTGPLHVPGWSTPITATNVLNVTLRAAYAHFRVEPQRDRFLENVARTVWQHFTSLRSVQAQTLIAALRTATAGHHLLLAAADPTEEELLTRLHVDGAMPSVGGDSLTVINQNLAANKVDFYLRRHVRYTVRVDPRTNPARIAATAQVILTNRAPAAGLPRAVIGPYDSRFRAGENRTYVSFYTPLQSAGGTRGAGVRSTGAASELGRRSYSAVVRIPATRTRAVRLDLSGRVRLAPGGWYQLELGRQPVIRPDFVDVTIQVPAGWRIAATHGLVLSRAGASAHLIMTRPTRLAVRIVRA